MWFKATADEDKEDIGAAKNTGTKGEQRAPTLACWKRITCRNSLDLVLMLATIALAFFTYRLWSDTHKLVLDAEKTETRQAIDMQESLGITKYAADAASVAANAARDSAMAAMLANRLNRDNFVADHRPWIAAGIQLVSPLTWGPNGGSITLRFTLRNTGHTPALDVWIIPKIFLLSDANPNPISEQRKISEEQRQRTKEIHKKFGGISIFPGEAIPVDITMTINHDDIERYRSSFDKNYVLNIKGFGVSPFIVGCVDYRLVLGGVYHQTGFILALQRVEPNRPGVYSIDPEKGDEPISQLIITRDPFMGDGITD